MNMDEFFQWVSLFAESLITTRFIMSRKYENVNVTSNKERHYLLYKNLCERHYLLYKRPREKIR